VPRSSAHYKLTNECAQGSGGEAAESLSLHRDEASPRLLRGRKVVQVAPPQRGAGGTLRRGARGLGEMGVGRVNSPDDDDKGPQSKSSSNTNSSNVNSNISVSTSGSKRYKVSTERRRSVPEHELFDRCNAPSMTAKGELVLQPSIWKVSQLKRGIKKSREAQLKLDKSNKNKVIAAGDEARRVRWVAKRKLDKDKEMERQTKKQQQKTFKKASEIEKEVGIVEQRISKLQQHIIGSHKALMQTDLDHRKLVADVHTETKKAEEAANEVSRVALRKAHEISKKLDFIAPNLDMKDYHRGLLGQFFSVDIDDKCRFPKEITLVNSSSLKRIVKDVRFHMASNLWSIHRTWRVGGSALPKAYSGSFAAEFNGKLLVPQEGVYTFYTESDDASWLYVDGNLVVNNTGCRDASKKMGGRIVLQNGLRVIQVRYTRGTNPKFNSERANLLLSWKSEMMDKEEIIPASQLYVSGGLTSGVGTVARACKDPSATEQVDWRLPLDRIKLAKSHLREMRKGEPTVLGIRCCKGAGDKLQCTAKEDASTCLKSALNHSAALDHCAGLTNDGGGWHLCSREEIQSKGKMTGTTNGPCCVTNNCTAKTHYVWTRDAEIGPGHYMLFKAMEQAKEVKFKAGGIRLKKNMAIEIVSKATEKKEKASIKKQQASMFRVLGMGECRTESGSAPARWRTTAATMEQCQMKCATLQNCYAAQYCSGNRACNGKCDLMVKSEKPAVIPGCDDKPKGAPFMCQIAGDAAHDVCTTISSGVPLLSYYDKGKCGPIGDNANWDWCGRSQGICKNAVKVARCPNGYAYLNSLQRPAGAIKNFTIVKGSAVERNLCSYGYYAEYRCYGRYDWAVMMGQCASSSGKELKTHTSKEGGTSIHDCKRICSQTSTCSAVEWARDSTDGKCKLIVDAATKADAGSYNRTVGRICYIKPRSLLPMEEKKKPKSTAGTCTKVMFKTDVKRPSVRKGRVVFGPSSKKAEVMKAGNWVALPLACTTANETCIYPVCGTSLKLKVGGDDWTFSAAVAGTTIIDNVTMSTQEAEYTLPTDLPISYAWATVPRSTMSPTEGCGITEDDSGISEKDTLRACVDKCSACPSCVGFDFKHAGGEYRCSFSSKATPSKITLFEKPSWQRGEGWSFYINTRKAKPKPVIVNGWTSLPRVALHTFFDEKSLDASPRQAAGPVSSLNTCMAMCAADPKCAGTSWRARGEAHPDYHKCFFITKDGGAHKESADFLSALKPLERAKALGRPSPCGVTKTTLQQKSGLWTASVPLDSTCGCKQLCSANTACNTWAFMDNRTKGGKATCMLSAAKNLVKPTATPSLFTGGMADPADLEYNSVDGCRVEKNYRYEGDDLFNLKGVRSTHHCASKCAQINSCASFSYIKDPKHRDYRTCHFKSKARPYKISPNDSYDSGLPCFEAHDLKPKAALALLEEGESLTKGIFAQEIETNFKTSVAGVVPKPYVTPLKKGALLWNDAVHTLVSWPDDLQSGYLYSFPHKVKNGTAVSLRVSNMSLITLMLDKTRDGGLRERLAYAGWYPTYGEVKWKNAGGRNAKHPSEDDVDSHCGRAGKVCTLHVWRKLAGKGTVYLPKLTKDAVMSLLVEEANPAHLGLPVEQFPYVAKLQCKMGNAIKVDDSTNLQVKSNKQCEPLCSKYHCSYFFFNTTSKVCKLMRNCNTGFTKSNTTVLYAAAQKSNQARNRPTVTSRSEVHHFPYMAVDNNRSTCLQTRPMATRRRRNSGPGRRRRSIFPTLKIELAPLGFKQSVASINIIRSATDATSTAKPLPIAERDPLIVRVGAGGKHDRICAKNVISGRYVCPSLMWGRYLTIQGRSVIKICEAQVFSGLNGARNPPPGNVVTPGFFDPLKAKMTKKAQTKAGGNSTVLPQAEKATSLHKRTDPTNIAQGKPTKMSSTLKGADGSRAVDGIMSQVFADGSCTHTQKEANPWWRVDLLKTTPVKTVTVWNRADCCGSRLSRFEVRIGDSSVMAQNEKCDQTVSTKPPVRGKVPPIHVGCGGRVGRYVFITVPRVTYLTLCEVKINAMPETKKEIAGIYIGEVGTVVLKKDDVTCPLCNMRKLRFKNTYQKPVVYAQALEGKTKTAATVRILQLSRTGCTLFIQDASGNEAKGKPVRHGDERVSYIVMEAGRHTTSDGTYIEAGIMDGTHSTASGMWDSVAVKGPTGRGYATSPAVFAQVQTYSNSGFATTRVDQVTRTSFKVMMQRNDPAPKGLKSEKVGWITMPFGTGKWPGKFEVGQTGHATIAAKKAFTVAFLSPITVAGAEKVCPTKQQVLSEPLASRWAVWECPSCKCGCKDESILPHEGPKCTIKGVIPAVRPAFVAGLRTAQGTSPSFVRFTDLQPFSAKLTLDGVLSAGETENANWLMAGEGMIEKLPRGAKVCPKKVEILETPKAQRWKKWECPSCDCGCEDGSIGKEGPRCTIKAVPAGNEVMRQLNFALLRPTNQSSTFIGGNSSNAVDGNKDRDFFQGSCTRTSGSDSIPWWSVDLESPQRVKKVTVTNRGDCCGDIDGFEVRVGDLPSDWGKAQKCGGLQSMGKCSSKAVACNNLYGRYVFVLRKKGGVLSLCEVAVEVTPASDPIVNTQALVDEGARFVPAPSGSGVPYCDPTVSIKGSKGITKNTWWTIYNKRYSPIAMGSTCCRKDALKQLPGFSPLNCQDACDKNRKCNFFSHSKADSICRLCWHCNSFKDKEYTSWEKEGVAQSPVTCHFTLKDVVSSVHYNEQDISSRIVGDRTNVKAMKEISFTPTFGAFLTITGYDKDDGGDACKTGGFAIKCSSASGAWMDVNTTTPGWAAYGSRTLPDLKHQQGDGNGWIKPCNSKAKFGFPGLHAPFSAASPKTFGNKHQFVALRFRPGAPRRQTTGGKKKSIFDIAPSHKYVGCFSDTGSKSDLRFGPKKGGFDAASCMAACIKQAYTYMALQTGGRCFCDNYYSRVEGVKMVSSRECESATAKSPRDRTGGIQRNAVFKILAPPDFNSLLYYDKASSKVFSGNIVVPDLDANSPADCQTLCTSMDADCTGFSYENKVCQLHSGALKVAKASGSSYAYAKKSKLKLTLCGAFGAEGHRKSCNGVYKFSGFYNKRPEFVSSLGYVLRYERADRLEGATQFTATKMDNVWALIADPLGKKHYHFYAASDLGVPPKEGWQAVPQREPASDIGMCKVRLPTGCVKPLRETKTPKIPFLDPAAKDQSSCEGKRKQSFRNHCGKTDSENTWVQCNWSCYLNRYDDLTKAFGKDTKKAKNHWLKTGIKEYRLCDCDGPPPLKASQDGESPLTVNYANGGCAQGPTYVGCFSDDAAGDFPKPPGQTKSAAAAATCATPYQLKARGGKCLDDSQRNLNGGKVHFWSCNTKKNQHWVYTAVTGQIKSKYGKCLDASQRNRDGGKVQMWSCNTKNKNQRWVYNVRTGQIKAKHGKCLDASQRNRNGGKVQMWSCQAGHKNQQFDLGCAASGAARNKKGTRLGDAKSTKTMKTTSSKKKESCSGCACKCKAFAYFALQNGGQCACDNSYASAKPKPQSVVRVENIVRSNPTAQSSSVSGGISRRAVDGNTNTNYGGGSCTHTRAESEPWWRVKLKKETAIESVQVWNRGDCCGSRLNGFEVRVGNNGGNQWKRNGQCSGKQNIAQGKMKAVGCNGRSGRYVFVVLSGPKRTLSLCEVKVFPSKKAIKPSHPYRRVPDAICNVAGFQRGGLKANAVFKPVSPSIHYVSSCFQCGINWCAKDTLMKDSAKKALNRADVESLFTMSNSLKEWGCDKVTKSSKAVRNSLSGAVYAVESSRPQAEAGDELQAEIAYELAQLDTVELLVTGEGYGENLEGKSVADGGAVKMSSLKKDPEGDKNDGKVPEPENDECPKASEVSGEPDAKDRMKVWEDPTCENADCKKIDYKDKANPEGFCVVKTKQGSKNKQKLLDEKKLKMEKKSKEKSKKMMMEAKKKQEKVAKEIKKKKAEKDEKAAKEKAKKAERRAKAEAERRAKEQRAKAMIRKEEIRLDSRERGEKNTTRTLENKHKSELTLEVFAAGEAKAKSNVGHILAQRTKQLKEVMAVMETAVNKVTRLNAKEAALKKMHIKVGFSKETAEAKIESSTERGFKAESTEKTLAKAKEMAVKIMQEKSQKDASRLKLAHSQMEVQWKTELGHTQKADHKAMQHTESKVKALNQKTIHVMVNNEQVKMKGEATIQRESITLSVLMDVEKKVKSEAYGLNLNATEMLRRVTYKEALAPVEKRHELSRKRITYELDQKRSTRAWNKIEARRVVMESYDNAVSETKLQELRMKRLTCVDLEEKMSTEVRRKVAQKELLIHGLKDRSAVIQSFIQTLSEKQDDETKAIEDMGSRGKLKNVQVEKYKNEASRQETKEKNDWKRVHEIYAKIRHQKAETRAIRQDYSFDRRKLGCYFKECPASKCRERCPIGTRKISYGILVVSKCQCACGCKPITLQLRNGLQWVNTDKVKLRSLVDVDPMAPKTANQCKLREESRVALCKKGGRVQGCVDGQVYVFYCGCDHLYQWYFTRRQPLHTVLQCNMTHTVAPQLPSDAMFAAWYRVCKMDYPYIAGECGLPKPPPSNKKMVHSIKTNATEKESENKAKGNKSDADAEQDLGDTGERWIEGGEKPYHLHHEFFSKREGIQPKAIAYRLNEWERKHRSDCATPGAQCKTKLVAQANKMIVTEKRKKAADGFKFMRGFNTWYENAKTPSGFQCSAFFAFGVSVCNKGGSVAVRCDIDGEEAKGGLEIGCGCGGVYLQGTIFGYMPQSISQVCAGNMQRWTQKAEQSFMRTSQAERCVAKAHRACSGFIQGERNGKQMVKDKQSIDVAKKELSLHQVVRTISKANDEAEKEKRRLTERLANPVFTYLKIPGFGIHASGGKSSLPACQNDCSRQPTCKAFSYNKLTESCALSGTTIDVNDNYVLYSRENAAEWHSTTFTEIPGMTFAADDGVTGIAGTAAKCKLDCLANRECNAVSYSKVLKKCIVSKAGLHLGSDWDYYEKQRLSMDSNESIEENNAQLHIKEMKIKQLKRSFRVGVEAANLVPGAPRVLA